MLVRASISTPVLPDGSVVDAKGEALTTDTPAGERASRLAVASWREIEKYSQAFWLRDSDGKRVVESHWEARYEDRLPVLTDYQQTNAFPTVTSFDRWTKEPAAWNAITPVNVWPDGTVEAPEVGVYSFYRIIAEVVPPDEIPDNVRTAFQRVYSYMYHHTPAREK